MEENPEDINDGNLTSADETLQVDAVKQENTEESASVVDVMETKSLPVSIESPGVEESPGETNDDNLAGVDERLPIEGAKQENIEERASVVDRSFAAKLDTPEVEEREDGTLDD